MLLEVAQLQFISASIPALYAYWLTVPSAPLGLHRILVKIYGSPDLFVKEYCNLLADRLLASLSYDVSREVCLASVLLSLYICTYICVDLLNIGRVESSERAHTDAYSVDACVLPQDYGIVICV